MSTEKQRIKWVDVARVLAIVAVVICHVIETEYYSVRIKGAAVSDLSWYFQNLSFTFGRLGVPLFLMLTGTLMLGREYDFKNFYRRSFLPLLLTTEIWIVINYVFSCYQYAGEFSIKQLAYMMTFMRPSSLNHMWYMPMILGIYLVIPLLAKALRGVAFSDIWLPLLAGGAVFFLVPLFNAVAGELLPGWPDANVVFGTSFLGGTYGLILVIGYYVGKQQVLQRCRVWWLVVIAGISVLLNMLGARLLYTRQMFHSDVFGWYTSPFILVTAICCFELLRRVSPKKLWAPIVLISKGSFGIYLLHNIVLILFDNAAAETVWFTSCNVVVRAAIRFTVAFGIPVLIVGVFDKIPIKPLKKYLLFMK